MKYYYRFFPFLFITPLIVSCSAFIPPCGTNHYKSNNTLPGFGVSPFLNEQILEFNYQPQVKVTINAPSPQDFNPDKKVMLIFYALPNFNNTAETIGKKIADNINWRYSIQQIGAQTRFLRQQRKNYNIITVFVETEQLSWPWWSSLHNNGDNIILGLVDSVQNIFRNYEVETVLDGHSGGGRFIFGYINSVSEIPNNIKRIAFLESDYYYENVSGHGDKLINWLKDSDDHFLNVISYDDRDVLEDGKPLQSASNSSYDKTNLMKKKFETKFDFNLETDSAFAVYNKYTALNDRLQIIMVENPKKIILHTVIVERNGFIQSINSGTKFEGKDYVFMGEHAYDKWIQK